MAKAKKAKDKDKEVDEIKEEKQEITEESVEESVEKPEGEKEKKKRGKKEKKEGKKPEEELEEEEEEETKEEEEEEEGEFKLYRIPLRDAFNAPKTRRASKAVKIVKEFLKKHTKSEVKLDASVNESLFARGIKKPPRRIKVKVIDKEREKEGVKIPVKIAKLAE